MQHTRHLSPRRSPTAAVWSLSPVTLCLLKSANRSACLRRLSRHHIIAEGNQAWRSGGRSNTVFLRNLAMLHFCPKVARLLLHGIMHQHARRVLNLPHLLVCTLQPGYLVSSSCQWRCDHSVAVYTIQPYICSRIPLSWCCHR